MDYAGRYNLVSDNTFRNRLQMALWIAAADILIEDGATPNHVDRVNWANTALQGTAGSSEMQVTSIRASANASIGASGLDATDGDIQYVVNGLINELAG
jgi:hypothetical protein